jgi:glycosyltransferase involved in cell wall biosynthesis
MDIARAPALSVVLPVRNQADHIEPVIREYLRVLPAGGRSFELVLVPNACTDASPEICRALASQDDRIRVAENPKGGWGLSVRVGLGACRGEALCYTNSARTDPGQILALLARFQEHPSALVKIARHSRGAILREAGSFLYNLECQLLLRTRVRDVNGTPKIFHRSLLDRFPLISEGDLLDAELLSRCARARIRVVEVALPGWKRHGGSSSTKLGSARRMYVGVVKLFLSLPGPVHLQEPRR